MARLGEGGGGGGRGRSCVPPPVVAADAVLAVVDGAIAIVAFLQVGPLNLDLDMIVLYFLYVSILSSIFYLWI